ncbi:MAG: SMC family ATPase [bacterium]|nr:SMC family ATPase [bacterium]
MRLLSIDITNFRVIKQARLDFSDSLTGIIGPNGAGKSSLIEAVAWSLYGNRVARSGKDEIRSTFAHPDENCQVSLSFDIAGEHYRIVRRLVGRKERAEVELYRGATSESVGSIETLRHVTGLLGLDWRGFLSSFLARQQELNALADLPPGQRREHLAGMLGIERLDKALQRVKEDGKLYQRSAEMIGRQVQEKEALAARIKELGEQADSLTVQRDNTSGAYDEARLGFGSIEAIYQEHQEKQTSCSRITAELNAASAASEHQDRQLETLLGKEKQLAGASRELDRLQIELKEYGSLKEQLDTAARARQADAHRTDLSAQAERTRAELADLTKDLGKVKEDLGGIAKALSDLPEQVKELHQASVEKLEQARREWNEANSSLKVIRADISKVETQILSMDQIGPEAVCDRCHRPFGADLPGIKKHLKHELSELTSVCSRSETDLGALTQEGENLKRRSAELEIQSRNLYELNLKAGALEKRKTEIEVRQVDLKRQAEQLGQQLAKLGEVSFDPDVCEALTGKVKVLERKQAEAQELKGQLAGIAGLEQEIAEARERLLGLKAEEARLSQERVALDFDEEKFSRLKAEFSAARQQMEAAKDTAVRATTALEVVLKEIELRTAEQARLDRAAEELEEYRTNQYYAEKLVRLFGDFRKFTIARIRPRLAQISSDLMLEMSDGRYSLVELDNDYNLRLMDYGQYFGIDRYSGGEKDLASLCLRLAISLALTESAGLDRSFVILDEVFGSQDEQRRDLIFQALAGLKARFPQILLVTHLEELKHKVETLVEVRPTGNGWSEVIVDGNPA